MLENVIGKSLPRRHFLQRAGAAAAATLAPWPLCAEQRSASASAFSGIATFEDVWRTVRDRFYDPRLRGLDWPKSENDTSQRLRERPPKMS